MMTVLLAALGLLLAPSAMALDLTRLWDFDRPALSEQRFRAALQTASGDDALILRTQIARTHGLRRDFAAARAELQALEPQLPGAGAEARVRHALEWGRSWVSATHDAASRTPEALAEARAAYERAFALARDARLDGLAVDAVHMMAFVDDRPEDQLRWAQEALALVLSSTQPQARRWEASIRNNRGIALHRLGRLDEALAEFEQAVPLREREGDAGRLRIAHWMVAWTLRGLGRIDEALALQQRLDAEGEAAGDPDPEVHAELAALYRAKGDEARAAAHAAREQALRRAARPG